MDIPSETTLIIAAIAAAVPPTLAALAAFITSIRNNAALDVVKEKLDGRLTELLAITKAAAFAKGVLTEQTTPAATGTPPTSQIGNN